MRYFAVVLIAVAAVCLVILLAWLVAYSTRTPAMRVVRQHNALKKQAAKELSKGNLAQARLLSKAADDVFQLTKDLQ